MKKLLSLFVLILFLQPLFGSSSFANKVSDEKDNTYLQQIKTESGKFNLKQRLLSKFAVWKHRRQTNEDNQRKTTKLFGTLSLIMGLLGIVSWIIGAVAIITFPILLSFLLLFPLALIFGITSLRKRKRLSDKKQISKIPAILGIIIGGLGVITFIVGIIIFLSTPIF